MNAGTGFPTSTAMPRPERVGIFGGTFDPVHLGHLLLAERCREECGLDQVWFLPAGIPPHKLAQTIAPGAARAEMLELSIAGNRAFRVDRRELKRRDPCFTVETLAELKSEDSSRELFFLMGADSLADFSEWRAPQRILELAHVVAVNRGGQPAPGLEPLRARFGTTVDQRIEIVTMPAIDLASREIRERVREGRSIRYMVPRAVECYIESHQLYRPPR